MSGNRAGTVADKTTYIDNSADACSEVSSCKNHMKSLLELSYAELQITLNKGNSSMLLQWKQMQETEHSNGDQLKLYAVEPACIS
jgi:hypothetical protein